MAHIFRSITLVVVLAATGAVVAGSASSSVDSSQSGAPDVEPLTDGEPLTDVEQAQVDWATARFAQAGLELPELTVRFDPTRDLCDHNEGRYHHAPNGDRVVTICSRDSGTFADQLTRRRTLLHEFGHAWDFANLSTEDRDELGRILGTDAWNDHDDAWADQGAERFAETFVFALLDQPRRVLKVGLDCSDLLSAFGTATGAEPLGPGLPSCAA